MCCRTARPLRRLIVPGIENPLADLLLQETPAQGTAVTADAENDGFVLRTEPAAAPDTVADAPPSDAGPRSGVGANGLASG